MRGARIREDARLEICDGMPRVEGHGPPWLGDPNVGIEPARLAGVAKLVDATDLS
jgi:hypothetical protein